MKNIYKVKGNIIITSDEEIKDCYVLTDLDKIIKVDESNEEQWHEFNCEKIILTTDEQLISDGVQSIDKPFLIWLINNPNCDEVQVYYDLIEFEFEKHSTRKKYIIIIPKEKHKRKIDTCYNFNKEIGCVQLDCRCEKEESKFEKSIENTINFMNIANAMFSKKEEPKQYTSEEEPKQGIDIQEFEKKANEIIANVGKKETLEEAVDKYTPLRIEQKAFIAGAEYQAKRMYSEKEVLEIIRQYALEEHLITSSKPDIWFEQFKKK